MENLTLAAKIIKPHTADPLEGHTVVIFEQVGDAGEEFRFEIKPGERVPKTRRNLFQMLRRRKPPNYIAYAVTGLPDLRWTFTTDVTLDVQAHSFTLLVTPVYSVSEPYLLVTRRNDDPIRQVRDYISALLARHFAQRAWSEIRHDFRTAERLVVAAVAEPVRQFAAHYGLRVSDLALSHRLQDKDFGDILEQEAAQRAKERVELVAEIERAMLVQDAQTEAMKTWLEIALSEARKYAQASSSNAIRSPEELLGALTALQGKTGVLASLEIEALRYQVAAPSDRGDLNFRAVWSDRVTRHSWTSFFAYVYAGLEGAMAVENDLYRRIGELPAPRSTATTATDLPLGADIRVIPVVSGAVFEPSSITLRHVESWERADFKMRVIGPTSGIGFVRFYVEALLVCELSVRLSVSTQPTGGVRGASGSRYRKIFACYSREDTPIVRRLERAVTVLGDEYLRDVTILRSGQEWEPTLLEKIAEADIFQLCWSQAARCSQHVEKEWRHALGLERPEFISPVYWQEPMAEAPPELGKLHFAYFEIDV